MQTFYRKLIEVFEKPENKALFTNKNLTPIQYIDLYAAQEQFEENFELFTSNALLVEWSIDYSGDTPIAIFTLYCCYEQLRDTSNISQNRELGLKFLDYIDCINEVAQSIETEKTGKPELVTEGFHKMDSIVDVYLLTYECSYSGRKNPLSKYQAGDYDKLDMKGTLKYDMD